MDWFTPVDIYCERVGPAFWAEPWNALSNLAFIIAALWGAVAGRRRGAKGAFGLLTAMVGLIGIGSFLFHTFANTWSEYADTIPIWSFVAYFVFVAAARIGGMNPGKLGLLALSGAAVVVVVLLASGEGHDGPPGVLNGSGQYAPALIALLVFSALTWQRKHPVWPWVWAATGVFFLALIFRTIDVAICPTFPIGSHFMWHLLNALMIGLLLQLLLSASPQTKCSETSGETAP